MEDLINKKYQNFESKYSQQLLKLTEQLYKSMLNDLLKHNNSPSFSLTKTHQSFTPGNITLEIAKIIEKISN